MLSFNLVRSQYFNKKIKAYYKVPIFLVGG